MSLPATTSLSRRQVLRLLLTSGVAALSPWHPARADGAYDGPFVDAHAHLNWDAGVSIDQLMALYDAAGVKAAVLFGYPWQLAADGRDRYLARVVPFLAEGYAYALHPDSSYMHPDGLKQLLDAGVVGGFGEVICRHSASQLGAPVAGTTPSRPATCQPTTLPSFRPVTWPVASARRSTFTRSGSSPTNWNAPFGPPQRRRSSGRMPATVTALLDAFATSSIDSRLKPTKMPFCLSR